MCLPRGGEGDFFLRNSVDFISVLMRKRPLSSFATQQETVSPVKNVVRDIWCSTSIGD
jgi:hypothetical protein